MPNKEIYYKNADRWKKYSRDYYYRHLEKCRKYAREYAVAHREQKRNNDLKLKYSITLEDYNKLLKEQNGVCAICEQPEKSKHPRSKKPNPLSVDHSHKTGKVRGLLCLPCNRAVGVYELYKERVENYLNRTNKRVVNKPKVADQAINE